MSLVYGWHSHGQEPPTSDQDQTGLVVPSPSLSCRQAYEGDNLHTAVVELGRWPLPQRRGGTNVFDSMWLINAGGGTKPPMILKALLFDVVLLRVKVCFLEAIVF